MTRYYCTSFDADTFLLRGLALYHSLVTFSSDFVLWVLCMDDESERLITKLALPQIRCINIRNLEDERLLEIKEGRSLRAYSITCKSVILDHLLRTETSANIVSWLDADLYFYSSPELLFTELGEYSIGITEHNFSENRESSEKHGGKYNAGFMMFRNDEAGRRCVSVWKEQCLEWCFEYHENGKYGEQMYLNEWPDRYPDKVKVFSHRGANVAYWNIDQYKISFSKNSIRVLEKVSGTSFPLIFYHFSGLIFYTVNRRFRVLYRRRYLLPGVMHAIYRPYYRALEWSLMHVRKTVNGNFDRGLEPISFGRFMAQWLHKTVLSYCHAILDRK